MIDVIHYIMSMCHFNNNYCLVREHLIVKKIVALLTY